jgi:hypothetical protein
MITEKDLAFIRSHIAVDRIIAEYKAKHTEKPKKTTKSKRCKRNKDASL